MPEEPSAGKKVAFKPASDAVISIARDTFERERQLVVFVNTKRGAESQAEKIAAKLETSEQLRLLSQKALQALSSPTKQCKRLARCLEKGVAFHHAGLHSKQRELIEEGFRERIVKAICATPTLCLHKDTLVWHGMREKPVASIKSGVRITGLKDYRSLPVVVEETHKLSNNQKKLISLTTVSGHVVSLTQNHRLLVRRSNKKMLIKAYQCKKTDYIATQGKITIKPKNVFFSKFVKDHHLPFQDRILQPDDYYLLGAMLGDGYSGACFNNKRIEYKGSPSIVGVDKEIFSQIKNSCKVYGLNHRLSKTYHGTPQLILGKNNWFREYLCRSGIEQRENKHIHSSLLEASTSCVSSLLRGLFDTDGYVEKGKSVGFTSISYNMIRQMQKLLLRFGIISRLRQRKASSMKIYDKDYQTKTSYEITIAHKESLLLFYDHVGFLLERKQVALEQLIKKLLSNIHYVHCPSCNYKIYADLFKGRSIYHKKWGKQKKEFISFLGYHGEQGSRFIAKKLGFEPKKKDSRLNHHYELITKRKIGKISNNEWFWSLNEIGIHINEEYLKKNIDLEVFFSQTTCPLCSQTLSKTIRNGWRTKDREEDIYWDKVKTIQLITDDSSVYDVVLPNDGSNDHLLVANGIFVHNSAGVDLPAFRVIVRDLKRYGGPWGMTPIPVLEYEQMAGRAGRPGKDPWGEAICIAKTESDAEKISEAYLNGEPEEIYSKLAVEPVLRTYILSLVASEFIKDVKELYAFFDKTFHAYQYGDITKLRGILDAMIVQLQKWEFLKKTSIVQDDFVSAADINKELETTLEATILGKRVSELYLDPYTANHLLKGLRRSTSKYPTPFAFVHLCASTLELRPYVKVRQADMDFIDEKLALESKDLLYLAPGQYTDEYDTYLDTVKTAMLMDAWMEEADEESLLEVFGVRPGELHAKLALMDWLVYATSELAKIISFHEQRKLLLQLRVRLKHGAKEELLPLLKLREVGRVRARKLFQNTIRDVAGLQRIDPTSLAQLVGKAVAIKLKEQVGQKVAPDSIKVKPNKRKGQKALVDWE